MTLTVTPEAAAVLAREVGPGIRVDVHDGVIDLWPGPAVPTVQEAHALRVCCRVAVKVYWHRRTT